VPLFVFVTLPGDTGDSRAAAGDRRPLVALLRGALKRAYASTFAALERAYGRLLAVGLDRPLDVLLALALVTGATAWLAKQYLGVAAIPEEEQSTFEIDAELSSGTSLEEAAAYFRGIETILEGLREELELEYYFIVHSDTWGEIEGVLRSDRDNELSAREVTERVLAALPEQPGVKLYTGEENDGQQEDQRSLYTTTLFGDDPLALERVATGLEEQFARVDGVLGVKKAIERAPNELALILDRELAQRQAINPEMVAGMVSYALRGQSLPRLFVDGRDIPVRVRFREEDRETIEQLASFAVPAAGDRRLPLAALVDVQQLPAPTRIFRRDQRTARRLTVELEEGKEKSARGQLAALTTRIDLPEGVSLGADLGIRRGPGDDIEGLLFGASLSVVFVYLLMAFLFESLLLPLAILVTMPLAGLGVVWIHLAARIDIDSLGFVAVILLIGVVVNNGIVLLDCVNQLHRGGMERRQASLLAAERRFRPIMMTALTTIIGMIPLTRMGLSYASFGLTLIGGMATATLLTLLVVPVVYNLVEDGRAALGHALAAGLAPGRGAAKSAVRS
jgi:HAE1 family hydrophobic/amphiphilic exporter-1